MIARDLPKYCTWNKDRHGKRRVRFREGHFTTYISGVPYSESFMQKYYAALDHRRLAKQKQLEEIIGRGTIDSVVTSFYGSADYQKLKLTTRRVRRNILERFRLQHGTKRVATLTAAHIKAVIGDMADRPEAANSLLKALRVLLRHAVDMGLIQDDPSRNVRKYVSKSDGHHSWSEAEVEQFELRHPHESKANFALTLLLYTGQRRGDVVRMGWRHLDGDVLTVVQDKTGAHLRIPMHPKMIAALATVPRRNATFLTTEYGKPYSAAGFGNWFRDRCDEAGLPHCSAHGLRKACATRLANSGCTPEQIKSITGHKTLSEVARYTKAADQERNAKHALAKLLHSESTQVCPTPLPRLDTKDKNRFEINNLNVEVASRKGFEPLTPGLGNRCSILLSYRDGEMWSIISRWCVKARRRYAGCNVGGERGCWGSSAGGLAGLGGS
jgi:integrase